MKTIEQKAKAYDKAIAHTRLLLKTIGNATLGNLVLKNEFENMFPELKESEPKFKIGDLVVDNCGYVWRIEGIINQFYILDDVIDGGETRPTIEWVNKTFHLWSIQDAKDGDVLVASDGSIFIFASVVDCACKHYVSLTTDGVININEGLEHYWETSRAVHPATKEQREQLEKAMADAGYTFDFEKKELKKIEQKPVVPKFKVGDVIRNKWSNHTKKIVRIADDNSVYFLDDGMPGDYISAPISNQENWVLVEQKTAWSEEDEKYYNDILDTVNNDLGLIHVHRDWFKNIKYRIKSISPQNTWKPSDEQLDALYDAAVYVDKSMFPYQKGILMKLYKQLKKLKGD